MTSINYLNSASVGKISGRSDPLDDDSIDALFKQCKHMSCKYSPTVTSSVRQYQYKPSKMRPWWRMTRATAAVSHFQMPVRAQVWDSLRAHLYPISYRCAKMSQAR